MKNKKFMALLLSVMLVLGTCVTGISVSAEEVEESYQLSTAQVFTTQPETEAMTTEETTTQTEPAEEAEVSEIPQLIGNTKVEAEPAEKNVESDSITVYFENEFIINYDYYYDTYSWDTVYVYYWSDDNDSMVEYPGVEMDYLYIEEYDYYTEYR